MARLGSHYTGRRPRMHTWKEFLPCSLFMSAICARRLTVSAAASSAGVQVDKQGVLCGCGQGSRHAGSPFGTKPRSRKPQEPRRWSDWLPLGKLRARSQVRRLIEGVPRYFLSQCDGEQLPMRLPRSLARHPIRMGPNYMPNLGFPQPAPFSQTCLTFWERHPAATSTIYPTVWSVTVRGRVLCRLCTNTVLHNNQICKTAVTCELFTASGSRLATLRARPWPRWHS